MRILLDQGTPLPLRYSVAGHSIHTVHEFGWTGLSDYELLTAAEREQFEIFITPDAHLSSHHDLSRQKLAVIVLTSSRWKLIRLVLGDVEEALANARPGEYLTLQIPDFRPSEQFSG